MGVEKERQQLLKFLGPNLNMIDHFTIGFCVYVQSREEQGITVGEPECKPEKDRSDFSVWQTFNQYRFEKKYRKMLRWPPIYANDTYIIAEENEKRMEEIAYKESTANYILYGDTKLAAHKIEKEDS